jgi:hypothetical protein
MLAKNKNKKIQKTYPRIPGYFVLNSSVASASARSKFWSRDSASVLPHEQQYMSFIVPATAEFHVYAWSLPEPDIRLVESAHAQQHSTGSPMGMPRHRYDAYFGFEGSNSATA